MIWVGQIIGWEGWEKGKIPKCLSKWRRGRHFLFGRKDDTNRYFNLFAYCAAIRL